MKFDRFVDLNVFGEYIQIYESIVFEFFLRLKIHKIGTYVLGFDKKKNSLSEWLIYKSFTIEYYISTRILCLT